MASLDRSHPGGGLAPVELQHIGPHRLDDGVERRVVGVDRDGDRPSPALGETAELALFGSRADLAAVGLEVGRGVLPMLASTASSTGSSGGSSSTGGSAPLDEPTDDGCSCDVPRSRTESPAAAMLALAALLARRRRAT